jgi:hypothetical protein
MKQFVINSAKGFTVAPDIQHESSEPFSILVWGDEELNVSEGAMTDRQRVVLPGQEYQFLSLHELLNWIVLNGGIFQIEKHSGSPVLITRIEGGLI